MLIDKQKDAGENITSLAEVISRSGVRACSLCCRLDDWSRRRNCYSASSIDLRISLTTNIRLTTEMHFNAMSAFAVTSIMI